MFNGKYTSLQEVIYRLKRHPLLANIEIADIAYDAMDVINLLGAPLIYESKVKFLDVEEFRTPLPCDLLYTLSVGRLVNDRISPMSSSTSTRAGNWSCVDANGASTLPLSTYAIKRGFIYTDFEEGTVEVNYKAVALDEDGYPMIPDHVSVIKAIEANVTAQHFKVKVDMGEIAESALRRAETDYSWYMAQAQSILAIPDVDEMESIKNGLIRLIHNTSEHDNGFRNLAINPKGAVSGNLNTGAVSGAQDTPVKNLLIQFNFGISEVELAPITVIEDQVGLYDTLQVDSGSLGGVINLNGVDTPVPFSLAVGDTVIAKRTNGDAAGWLAISYNG